jgi:hypothetical protein
MANYGGQRSDLALKPALVEEFQASIFGVRPQNIYNLPDLTPHINHKGLVNSPDIKLANGMFIDKGSIDASLPTPDDKPDAFGFILQPANRLGREVSRNQVFFGKLVVEWLAHEHNAEDQVAVKPLEDRAALLGEIAMFQYCRSLDIPTFQPTAMLISDSSKHDHLLTKFQGRVETLDAWDWDELDIDEQWMLFGNAAETAALLNSELLFHGDLQGRNVATDELGGIFVVDPESMVSALEIADIAATAQNENQRMWALNFIKRHMSRELTDICNSVDEYIFKYLPEYLRPATDMAKFKEYKRHIFRPYKEGLIARAPKYLPVLLQAYDLMIHEKKHIARGETPHA